MIVQVLKLDIGYNISYEIYGNNNKPNGTILMVNGAMATSDSLKHTVSYLKDFYKVVVFDLPFLGKSRELNTNSGYVGLENEVTIIDCLCSEVNPDFLISMSWGSASTLHYLASSDHQIKKVVLGSFTPIVTDKMREVMMTYLDLLEVGDHLKCAKMFNQHLGSNLSRLLQLMNAKYLKKFADVNSKQLMTHIRYVLSIEDGYYENLLKKVEIPMLFINGELDIYTPGDLVAKATKDNSYAQRVIIEGTGHFLDMENEHALKTMRACIPYFFSNEECYLEECS